MRARPGRLIPTLLLTACAVGAGSTALGHAASPDEAAAAPTTTAAATTTVAPSTTSPASTTTGVTTTTEAGPPPRASQRVAADVDIEKIRPTSLPLRMMAIAMAVIIAGLAIAGFVYGKVRSRGPLVTKPRPDTAADASAPTIEGPPSGPPAVTIPPPTPLPPPEAGSLPPPEPVTAWAPPKPRTDSDV